MGNWIELNWIWGKKKTRECAYFGFWGNWQQTAGDLRVTELKVSSPTTLVLFSLFTPIIFVFIYLFIGQFTDCLMGFALKFGWPFFLSTLIFFNQINPIIYKITLIKILKKLWLLLFFYFSLICSFSSIAITPTTCFHRTNQWPPATHNVFC